MDKKRKYAMVCINVRPSASGKVEIRRVLISYERYDNKVFSKTRFVEKDPYFYDTERSHKYVFDDSGYALTFASALFQEPQLLGKHRPYHSIDEKNVPSAYKRFAEQMKPVLFKAADDEEAKRTFKERKELN